MNTHIDFETAKLLKEKGFHEPAWQSYRTIEHIDDRLNWWKVGELNKSMYCKLCDSNDAYYGICSAPTIAEVVMWLYEKHGIWISVKTIKWNYENNTIRFNYNIVKFNDKNPSDITDVPYNFNLSTEAYQEAIKYCLIKLI